jgi:outer membrane protein
MRALAAALALAAVLPALALAQAPAEPPAPGSAAGESPPAAGAPAAGRRIVRLEEAVATARARQPTNRQARAGTQAAEARADLARSPLLPQLNASASYSRATGNVTPRAGSTVVPAPASWSSASYWSYGATLSQTVFDWSRFEQWGAAKASADAQREAERATGLDVVLNVRAAFFTARAGRDLVGVARETLQNQEAHLAQVQGFVEVGTRPEIDLAQARSDRANAQVQLIQAENTYENDKAQLNLAMGVEGPTDYDVADDTFPPVAGEEDPLEALVAEAVKARPDIAALGADRRAQEATVSASRGGYLPALGVSTGIDDVGVKLGSTVWNWNATATLTWNLFSGLGTTAEVRQARASLEQLDAQLDSLRQNVRAQVDQARLAVRAARAGIVAAEEALVNARERLRLAEGRYQAGAGSIIELGDAQVALTNAAAQRVQAQYVLSSARAQLVHALGRDDRA